jgi:hypothetical protein
MFDAALDVRAVSRGLLGMVLACTAGSCHCYVRRSNGQLGDATALEPLPLHDGKSR